MAKLRYKKWWVIGILAVLAVGGWLVWKYAHWNLSLDEVEFVTLLVPDYSKRGPIETRKVKVTDREIIRDVVEAWNSRTRTFRPWIAGYYGSVLMQCRDGREVEFASLGTGHIIESSEGAFYEPSAQGVRNLREIIGGQRDLGSKGEVITATQPASDGR